MLPTSRVIRLQKAKLILRGSQARILERNLMLGNTAHIQYQAQVLLPLHVNPTAIWPSKFCGYRHPTDILHLQNSMSCIHADHDLMWIIADHLIILT